MSSPWVGSFTERVDLFLGLATEIDGRRLLATGIDLGARFNWVAGGQTSGHLAPLDNDDFVAFIASWRLLVMRSEPTHLATVLDLCTRHLAHPKLRELAKQVADHLGAVNRNEIPVEMRPRLAFEVGGREYLPWDVADLITHGGVFHRRDRGKRAILEVLDPGARAMIEWIFRWYTVDVLESMDLTRLILLKASGMDALSNDPIETPPE